MGVEIQGDYSGAIQDVGPIAKKLINKFGGNELLVTELDFPRINFIWFSPKKVMPKWVAKVIKTPEYYTCLGVAPLIIICLKPAFDKFSSEMMRAVIFHELMHIGFDEKGNYKLVDHDLTDFEFLVKRIGLRYENATDMFKEE